MRLFIDGDAFPNTLKPIILKAINKRRLETIVVSNKKVFIGESPHITYEIVELGIDGADNHIVDVVKEGDFVITADIPLADKCVSKGALGLDHRGELFCEDNIKSLLAIRNLMSEIRDSGEITRGPKPFSKKDAEAFANGLYRFLDRC